MATTHRTKWLALAAIVLIAAVAAALSAKHDAATAGPHKLSVVATTSIIGDWAGIVGGDDIELHTLVGPDSDSHEFEPVPSDNLLLARADVIFENGLGLEGWLDKLYTASRSSAVRSAVTEGVVVRHVRATEGKPPNAANDDRDPHAWQNVADAEIMVADLRDALAKADPAHAGRYASRADAYLKQLQELDTWIAQQIATIPPASRKLVTSHNAFGYFGDRYGIDVTRSALESVTTEASDPSAKQLAGVVDQVKASGVPVIFVENIQNRKIIDQLAAEANVKVGPPLYSDALGKPGTAGESYVKMMRYNVETLVTALGSQ